MAAKTPAKKSSKSPRAAARPPAAKPGKSVKKAAPKAAPKTAPKTAKGVAKKAAPKPAPAKRATAPKAAKPARIVKGAKPEKATKAAKATKATKAQKPAGAKGAKVTKAAKPLAAAKVAKAAKAAIARPAKAPAPKRAGKVAAPVVRPAAPPAPRGPVARKKAPESGARQREPKRPEPPRPIDMEAFRVLLIQKREELLAMYRNDLRLGQEASDGPTEDIVDRANNSYTRELSFSISDAERTRVLQIDAALGRIDKGSFGRCGHCSREIPLLRLEALPWAHLCVECQELLEKGLLADA